MDSLWDHQVTALSKLRASAKLGRKRIVLQAPPGSGKTEVGVEVTKGARAKNNTVAFTVPLLNLVNQTVARFEKRGIPAEDLGVLQGRHEKSNSGAPVQVISVQTLASRVKKESFPIANVVIVDEAHIQFKVIKQWMEERPEVTFIGLSATPWSRGMADDWQDLQVVSTIPEMIGEGVLSPYRVFVPAEKPDLDGLPDNRITKDYAEGQLSERMSEKRIVADVVKTWLEKGEGRPTLAFCVDRNHAAAICTQFEEAGVRAAYVDANTEMDERAEYMTGLETGATKVICSIGTMTTGVDIPCVSCISYVRPTKSPILFVQSICRGLRSYPGKTDCLILDHSTTTQRLGMVGDINFPELLPGRIEKASVSHETTLPLPRECEACHFLIPVKTFKCPNCGAVPVRRTSIISQPGELVEFTRDAIDLTPGQRRDNKALTSAEKRRFYAELLGYGANKGYAPGWAWHKYQVRFGGKPLYDPPPIWPISPATAAWIRGQIQRTIIARQGGLRYAR